MKTSLFFLAVTVSACSQAAQTQTPAPAAAAPSAPGATATVQPLGASNVHGQLTFTPAADGMHVDGTLEGLVPGTTHGFHIHENGDCSAPDGKSAGGHFNPMGHQHAGIGDENSHAGDLGNVTADAQGVAHVKLVKAGATFDGPAGILRRAVIVHEKQDDLQSQPAGNAGARVACGVINPAS